MKQVGNLKPHDCAVLLPGIQPNTSPTNFHPIRQMQLSKWNGSSWELFGEIIEGTGA
jgi:branched-chain amino acid transport system substrate-binding protein